MIEKIPFMLSFVEAFWIFQQPARALGPCRISMSYHNSAALAEAVEPKAARAGMNAEKRP
jgi:hypothetical protein